MKKTFLVITSLILTYTSVLAADLQNVLTPQMKQSVKQSVDMPAFPNIIISTAIMIGMIYLVAFLYKKVSNFNQKNFSQCTKKSLDLNKLNIINSKSLGGHNALHIVEINGKYLLLGSTPSNISLLKEFDTASLAEEGMTVNLPINIDNIESPEQGLEALYPQEEDGEIISINKPKEEVKQEETTDFEQIYKKYL